MQWYIFTRATRTYLIHKKMKGIISRYCVKNSCSVVLQIIPFMRPVGKAQGGKFKFQTSPYTINLLTTLINLWSPHSSLWIPSKINNSHQPSSFDIQNFSPSPQIFPQTTRPLHIVISIIRRQLVSLTFFFPRCFVRAMRARARERWVELELPPVSFASRASVDSIRNFSFWSGADGPL